MQVFGTTVEFLVTVGNNYWSQKCKQGDEHQHPQGNHCYGIFSQASPSICPIGNTGSQRNKILFFRILRPLKIISAKFIPRKYIFNIRLQ